VIVAPPLVFSDGTADGLLRFGGAGGGRLRGRGWSEQVLEEMAEDADISDGAIGVCKEGGGGGGGGGGGRLREVCCTRGDSAGARNWWWYVW